MERLSFVSRFEYHIQQIHSLDDITPEECRHRVLMMEDQKEVDSNLALGDTMNTNY